MSERTDALRRALWEASRRGRLCVTGHDTPDFDSVVSCALLGDLCAWWGIEAHIVLPTRASSQPRRLLPGWGIDPDAWRGETAAGDFLAIVDHNAPLCTGTLVACIDHHPTKNPPDCAFRMIEDSGACAAILLRLMREAGMPPTRTHEALAVSALYLDTIGLRSTKIPPGEAAWAREAIARLGLDEAMLLREGMRLTDMNRPADELIRLGLKRYEFGGRRVISSYVQTNALDAQTLEAILTALRAAVREEGAALWVFLVHDPEAGRSTEFDVSQDGTKRIDYDCLISRGKDVMPRVEREMTLK